MKCRAKLTDKRIDDPDARVVLAVVLVFGIGGVAAEFQGGGEEGGIPIGKPVALLDPQGGARILDQGASTNHWSFEPRMERMERMVTDKKG